MTLLPRYKWGHASDSSQDSEVSPIPKSDKELVVLMEATCWSLSNLLLLTVPAPKSKDSGEWNIVKILQLVDNLTETRLSNGKSLASGGKEVLFLNSFIYLFGCSGSSLLCKEEGVGLSQSWWCCFVIWLRWPLRGVCMWNYHSIFIIIKYLIGASLRL